MPQPQTILGSFTSAGTAHFIPIRSGITKFELVNHTNYGTPAAAEVVDAFWQEGMTQDTALAKVFNGAATELDTAVVASNGIRVVNDALDDQLEAPVTGTALTAANPAVATATAHGYAVGDIVRVTNTTGMLQIAGMDFEITAVGGANNYTLGYLDASGFAAAATAITSRRLRYDNPFTPRSRYITNITQAASAVVTFSVTHGYNVGDSIKFSVPSDFGMEEIDGLVGEVTAVSLANNTVTVDIDSTGFTAFAFPASGSIPFSFPQTQFAGEDSTQTSSPYENQLRAGVVLGTNVVGASSDVIYWEATFGY